MKVTGVILSAVLALQAGAASQAVLNVASSNAATRTFAAYTNNVLPIVSADESDWNDVNPSRIRDSLPANMPFQLVVGPDAADRRKAEAAVAAATNAIPASVLAYFRETTTLGPLLQRVLRRCRPGIVDENAYSSARAHPAVWRARDFDVKAITKYCGNLASNSIPMLVALNPLYEEFKPNPITRAEPFVDYPDPRGETTFETPFGIGIVLRATERKRKFRFVATGWPVQNRYVSFKWVPLSSSGAQAVSVGPIHRQRELSPAQGYGELTLNWDAIRGRQDIAVFARYGNGSWGPPSIVSFYVVPNELRAYDRSGRIARIEYRQADAVIPELYQNKPWSDSYVLDTFEQVTGFMRLRNNSRKEEPFTLTGERVAETHASGLAKIAKKVRYFTRPDDPMTMDYEVTDETVEYPLTAFVPRTRGEFPAARANRR